MKAVTAVTAFLIFVLMWIGVVLFIVSSSNRRPRGYHDIEVIGGCQYIRVHGSWTHKGDCPNPIHVYNVAGMKTNTGGGWQ